MNTADNIALVCPLDWGIGHATRCVPVIRALEDDGYRVIVAADGRPYEFFRNECPGVELIRFPGTPIRYSVFKKHDSSDDVRCTMYDVRIANHQPPTTNHQPHLTTLAMLLTLPRLFLGFRKEHKQLAMLVEATGANLVVSDNRYGCWHAGVKSVFITHQLNIQVPGFMSWARPIIRKFIRNSISKYDECWIPDLEDEGGLSGRLSHSSGLPPNAHFIGLLTRFTGMKEAPEEIPCKAAPVFVMLSGPEPQRSILEKLIIGQLRETGYEAIIAGGRTESHQCETIDDRIHIFPHLPSKTIKHYINEAEYVICRSGYSTLMDLAALGKTAILIPTPGQTEQEYLANRLHKMNAHLSVEQKDFHLVKALSDFKGLKPVSLQNDFAVLKQRIKRLSSQAVNLRARKTR